MATTTNINYSTTNLFNLLPNEILQMIYDRLDVKDKLNLRQVSKKAPFNEFLRTEKLMKYSLQELEELRHIFKCVVSEDLKNSVNYYSLYNKLSCQRRTLFWKLAKVPVYTTENGCKLHLSKGCKHLKRSTPKKEQVGSYLLSQGIGFSMFEQRCCRDCMPWALFITLQSNFRLRRPERARKMEGLREFHFYKCLCYNNSEEHIIWVLNKRKDIFKCNCSALQRHENITWAPFFAKPLKR
jgi:hypothetical protein